MPPFRTVVATPAIGDTKKGIITKIRIAGLDSFVDLPNMVFPWRQEPKAGPN
jgi:hypothetical protein